MKTITTHINRINRVLVTNIIITKREIIVEIAKPQQEKKRSIG